MLEVQIQGKEGELTSFAATALDKIPMVGDIVGFSLEQLKIDPWEGADDDTLVYHKIKNRVIFVEDGLVILFVTELDEEFNEKEDEEKDDKQ